MYAWIMLRLGKERYLITGSLLALFLYAVCRLISSLTAPFGMWRRFEGICTRTENGCVRADFHDANRTSHTAVFHVPDNIRVQDGQPVRFAVRTESFLAGSYPQRFEDLTGQNADILHISAYRRLIVHTLLKTGSFHLIFCGAALAAFLIAAKLCFSGT
ncbi:MAG: hypothetical protein IK130_05675 [Oscillospiraceae bacterium]|nr:hypothetical protein [Oscillospiraceae bacterium]